MTNKPQICLNIKLHHKSLSIKSSPKNLHNMHINLEITIIERNEIFSAISLELESHVAEPAMHNDD